MVIVASKMGKGKGKKFIRLSGKQEVDIRGTGEQGARDGVISNPSTVLRTGIEQGMSNYEVEIASLRSQ